MYGNKYLNGVSKAHFSQQQQYKKKQCVNQTVFVVWCVYQKQEKEPRMG